MPEIVKAEILLLGDRNYPAHPTIKIPTILTATLPSLLTTALERRPDVTYDGLVRAVWALGLERLTRALAEGYAVEMQGAVVRYVGGGPGTTPEPETPEPKKPTVVANKTASALDLVAKARAAQEAAGAAQP